MMESSKPLRLLEVLVADAVSKEIQAIRDEICCGCKVYNQDCLMMTDHEAWNIHGLNALNRISHQTLVWNKFNDVMKILDMNIHSNFKDHLVWLLTEPDQDFVRDLLQLYENNHELLNIINNPTEPLEPYSECLFSYPPSYKYFVKGTQEQFTSRKGDFYKACHEYMKSKLRK